MLINNRNIPTDDVDVDMDISSDYFPELLNGNDPFNLDVDCPIPPETDLLQQLSNDLEIPMLLDDSPSFNDGDAPEEANQQFLLEPLLNLVDDPSQWATDAFPNLCPLPNTSTCEIKEEIKVEPDFPPSPPPSSAGSTSSLCNSEPWPADPPISNQSDLKFQLESPPLSPPCAEGSPPGSPHSGSISVSGPIKIIPCGLKLTSNNKLTLTHKSIPRIQPKPASSEVPVVDITKSQAVVNTAIPVIKEVCSTSRGVSAAEKRKTIVLSAKDFAALAQKMKGNQSGCTIGVLNGATAVPASVRLQPPQRSNPLAPAPSSPSPSNVLTRTQVLSTNPVPAQVPLIPCQPIASGVPTVSAIPVNSPSVKCSPGPVKREMEMKAIKRQQRMIKNRESACLSRKKKKEYVSSLEAQLSELQQENVQLKLENEALKDRLSEIENISSWTKPPIISFNTKKTTAVLAVLFLVSLNVGSFSGVLDRKSDSLVMRGSGLGAESGSFGPLSHRGRSLLWSSALDVFPKNDSRSEYREANSSANIPSHPICPLFINKTESIRLDSELRRWIGVDVEYPINSTKGGIPHHKSGNGKEHSVKTDDISKTFADASPSLPPSYQTLTSISRSEASVRRDGKNKSRRKVHSRSLRKNVNGANEVEVYGVRPPVNDYTAFLHSFHRREDTFYVVSFSVDHILLPAQAHNASARPKMSLVLPAVPLNESTFGRNHIRMMQIDCEVINTQMLRVREADIPAHVRPSAHRKYANSSKEQNTDAFPDKSANKPDEIRKADSPSVSTETYHNISQSVDQHSSSSSMPSYKPYFMKNSYAEKLTQVPLNKLNVDFLKGSKEVSANGDTKGRFVTNNNSTKLINYP